jgi:hypothetical protein
MTPPVRIPVRERVEPMATKKTTAKAKKEAPAAKKAGGKAKETAKKSAPKTKAAPAALSSAQMAMLEKIGGATAPGYLGAKKAELRTIEALAGRKLVKKGAKDKATGQFHYLLSSAGKKHLAPAASPVAPEAAPAPAPVAQAAPPPAAP